MNFCGLELKTPLMNASGVMSDHPAMLKEWEKAGVGAVVTKSITLDEKKPNPFYWDTNPPKLTMFRGKDWWINSMGLPNKGSEWWVKKLSRVKFNVPVIASVATATGNLSDYQEIIKRVEDHVDAFEINVSCPNTEKEIIGFNTDSLQYLVDTIDTSKIVGYKLPPYPEMGSMKPYELGFDEVGEYYLEKPVVTFIPEKVDTVMLGKVLKILEKQDFVTSHNTLSTEYPLLSMPRGGLSGRPIHRFAVQQAHEISQLSTLEIACSGGVLRKNDACDFFLIKNVKAVQLASGVFQTDVPELFVKSLLGKK